MKKGVISLALCLCLGLSPLCAIESAQNKSVQNVALSKADKEFLFTTNATHLNVVALSDEEMAETEGEALDPITGGLLIGIASGAGVKIGTELADKAIKKIKKWFKW
ncbi:hypothetical protein OQH61_08010 [Helicobacter sp. MIT 21-1697]|uniref:hypothetical protein n=1 Tax=Helicobacter sp. MIT 21-1697 TaxID=2993733 RepID=UPI00224B9AC8|nr:hypothetical protein [Helicobacter sp. MIT 21-1697]MCX2717677.1 hypothetical protein [Helicobacter sp. MIT 21-1697]